MKSILMGVLLLFGCLLLSADASAQNLLLNPSFETGDLTGWDLVGLGGSQSVGAPGIGAQSGSFAVNLTAPSDGVPEVSQGGFSQPSVGRFPASGGDEFNLSGYMLTEVALPAGPTFGLFKIVFEDAAGVDLAPASISIGQPNNDFPGAEALPFLNIDSPVNEWVFAEAQAVAPAGTASVFFLVLNVDFGNGANHPMWFDNVSATEVLPGVPGDFDGDGAVGGLDFLAWQRGESPTAFSAADLATWQGAYNGGALGALNAVPEPTSAWLVVMGSLLCWQAHPKHTEC